MFSTDITDFTTGYIWFDLLQGQLSQPTVVHTSQIPTLQIY